MHSLNKIQLFKINFGYLFIIPKNVIIIMNAIIRYNAILVKEIWILANKGASRVI